jgi:adenylate cyclase
MKRYPLRVAISTLVSGLILVSAAAIVTTLYFGAKRALVQTTGEMMGQIIQAMSDKLTERLARIERLNGLIADLVLGGTVKPADAEQITAFLRDAVQANPSVTLIDCALPSGDQYQALRMPDGSISRHSIRRTPRAVVSTWRHSNPAYAATFQDRTESLQDGYDPRAQPWWQAAVHAGKAAWTGIYSTRGGLNYANVKPVLGPGGNLVCVLNIDLRLEDLSLFLHRLAARRTGMPFITDPEFHVIAMPLSGAEGLGQLVRSVPGAHGPGFALRAIEDFPDGAIRHAVLRYRRAPDLRGRGFLAFRDPSGRRLLASFEREPKSGFTFGVVVPEQDILGTIKRGLDATLGLAALCFLASLAVAYGISRAIARPLATLAGQVDRIRRLDFADAPPVRTAISEVALIDGSVQNMRLGLRSFMKYVPGEVVTGLMSQQQEAVIGGEKRELTIFFSDIADFTRIAESLSPEALVEHLRQYFEEVARILARGSGTVDKFIGDAIMGFWGAPNALANHAELACRAALLAQDSIGRLNRRWAAEGGQAFRTRMGIHTGAAIVGNVGFEGRMNYTAMGDSVNLASRLEGLNKYYGTRILVSEATFRAAGCAVARMVDLVTVKGKEQPIGIYELLAMADDAPGELLAQVDAFGAAFAQYRNRRWAEALELLEGQRGGPVAVLAERCRRYQADPPGPEWDGVFRHQEK